MPNKPFNPSDPHGTDNAGTPGRPTFDPTNPGKNANLEKYGQSGGKPAETEGQARYRQSQTQGDPRSKQDSNKGSGRATADETTKDVPKTG